MKSDKKRSDRKKANKERDNRKKADREKSNKEKSNKEKSNKEELDIEKSNKKKPSAGNADAEKPDAVGKDAVREDVVKPDAIREDVVKPDAIREDAVRTDVEKADIEKKDAEMPDREEPDSAVSAESGHGGENGEEAPEESGQEQMDADEVSGEEKADSAAEADDRESDVSAEQAGSGFDDQEEEGEDWENDDLQDDWEEEAEPSKPWVMALVFLGMIFAAACICVMLWSFTHTDEQDKNVLAGVNVTPGNGDISAPNGTVPSGTGNLPLDDQGGSAASGSDQAESDTPAPDLNRVTTQEGRVIIFSECDDMVTPKEYVNLRTEPSTSGGEATVGCRLNNGEVAHRTGISEEMGWSRVEYNDQVLYVVSSYVNVVKDQTAE